MTVVPIDLSLGQRLREVGLDPLAFGDPAEAWRRLHERFGRRATLLDRYALAAAARGIRPEELDRAERARLAREVLLAQYPGIEFEPASGRTVTDRVEVVEHDASWASAFRIWHERLHNALGDAARRIDHVGSTAVAGLPAKPVIDIQVSVRDVEDEATYVAAITSIGIPLRAREPEHRYFRPGGSAPRDVQIHVCSAGSEWERDHLLFRDYLRAQPDARAAYARLKRDLATRYPDDRVAYNEGKTNFILDMLEEARGWAGLTRLET